MKKKILILFSCLLVNSLLAQDISKKWGNISEFEKNLKVCEFDSTANAVILLDKGEIVFNGRIAAISRHRRIKIFNRKGMEYADVKIPYYSYNNFENVNKIQAQTIIIEPSGKIKKVPVDKSAFFTNKLDGKWSAKTFSFPQVTAGVIVEYKYILNTADILFLDAWNFQNEIPTVHSELSMEIPSSLVYSYLLFGKKLANAYRDKLSTNKWELQNIPGYKNEKFVYNYKDYIDRIQFQLQSYRTYDEIGGVSTVPVMKGWKALIKELMDDQKFFLNKSKPAKKLLASIIDNNDPPKKKLEKIFSWVQENIKFNGYRSYTHRKRLFEIIEKKEANSAGINLLLTLLLRTAGFESSPYVLSTRAHGKVYQQFSFLNQFNHLISSVELDGQRILLDAAFSQQGMPYDILPPPDLNDIALKLAKGEPEWIDIKANKSTQFCMLKLDLSKEKPSCLISFRQSGYLAAETRVALNQTPNKVFTPSEIEMINLQFKYKTTKDYQEKDKNAETVFSYQYELEEGQLEDDLIYLTPPPLSLYSKNPFKNQKRSLPLELEYPFTDNYIFHVVLPNDYEVETLPEETVLSIQGNIGRFSYSAKIGGNNLIINARLSIKKQFIPVTYYPAFSAFFQRVEDKLLEPVVLKRK